MLGTGEGKHFTSSNTECFEEQSGKETKQFRVMCKAEYSSILNNNNRFIQYDFAMELKWFATSYDDAKKWGSIFYKNGDYIILEIIMLEKSLKYMFYAKSLDNIGPAYSADVELLNKIVRRLRAV